MFGLSDNTTQSNDDPAMLDNVKQLASEPADSVATATPASDPSPGSTAAQPDPTFTPMGQQMSTNAGTPSVGNPVVNPATTSDTPAQDFSMDTLTTSQANPATVTTDPQALSEDTNTDTSSNDEQPAPASDAHSVSAWSVSSPAEPSSPSQPTSDNSEPAGTPDPNHLAGLKQQALSHLEPLTEHLDGTPEEVFKTTMMMIQANDNHTLLEKALEAAKSISDDKERAQAMLDIVNEINYFSQNSQE